MVFNATFNNISVISWQSVFWWRKSQYPENTAYLPQAIGKLYHILLYIPPHELNSNSQLKLNSNSQL